MSDLISRSGLLNAFNNKNIQITFDLPVEEILGEDVDLDDFAMLVQDAIQVYKKMVIDTIEKQPTAYDADMVVEGLKELHEIYLNRYGIIGNSSLGAIERAIEIVKQGGVSDDVCEYKIKDKVIYASCNNKQIASAFCWFNECGDYKYCPYCGKKIKAVE